MQIRSIDAHTMSLQRSFFVPFTFGTFDLKYCPKLNILVADKGHPHYGPNFLQILRVFQKIKKKKL